MAITKTLPPLPVRKAPSIASMQAKKAGKPMVASPRPAETATPPRSTIPPRPSLPPRLTVPKTVKKPDGTTSIEEREVSIVEQDARIINHLAENGIATRKILAYLCGADEESVDKKMDSLRKRLNTLVQAGVLETVGNDQGSNTTYRITNVGGKFYSGSFLPDRFLPGFDESTMLNLSSVIARVTSPRTSSFFSRVPAGDLSVGLPVITRSRIASDCEQMVNRRGIDHRRQQVADAHTWLNDPNYPVVDAGWSMDEITSEQSDAITNYFHDGFRSQYADKPWVMPGYLFQIFDEYGNPQSIVDFVIPLPHIEIDGVRSASAVACFVNVEREADAVYRSRLTMVANSQVPFAKLVCFIPDTQVGIAKAVRENWKFLCDEGFVTNHRPEDLLTIAYNPINAPNVRTSFSTPDRPMAVKHFGRG